MFKIVNLILFLAIFHPLHLGVLTMDIQQSGSAIFSIRLFTDDLENAISAQKSIAFHFNHEDSTIVAVTHEYIKKNLTLSQHGEQLKYQFQNIEQRDDVTEITYRATIESGVPFSVCCSVFFEIFHDQTNLLIVKTLGKEDGFRLTSRNICISVEE